MKIKWAKAYLPHFRCTVCIGKSVKIPTHLLLDTGSPFTPILPKEYMRTRLKIKSTTNDPIHLAYAKFNKVPIKDEVIFRFESSKGELIKIPYNKAIYLVPDNPSPSQMDTIKAIPSIIGIDFLKNIGLKFVLDPKQEIIYLEGSL